MLDSEFWHANGDTIWLIGQPLALVFIASGIVNFAIKLVRNRRRIVALRDQGLVSRSVLLMLHLHADIP